MKRRLEQWIPWLVMALPLLVVALSAVLMAWYFTQRLSYYAQVENERFFREAVERAQHQNDVRIEDFKALIVYRDRRLDVEMRETLKIIRQCIHLYKDTEPQLMADIPQYISAPKERIMTENYSLMQHFVLVTQGMRPPVGEVYVPTESPKGELGFFIRSEGDPYPYRLKVRAPSFWHTSLLQHILPGHYLADVVTIIGNLNIVFGEIDRYSEVFCLFTFILLAPTIQRSCLV